MSKGKACGKFILLGEHFVIGTEASSGSPALAFPLKDLWCEVKLTADTHQHYMADLPGTAARDVVENMMARATYAAADSFRIDITGQPLRVSSRTNFPVSRGFGSSASFAVALARAFDEYRKSLLNPDERQNADWNELIKATGAVEKIFHGHPSGVDTAVILAERPIRFENGSILRELTNNAVDFVLVDGGSREGCAHLIGQVKEFREKHSEQWGRMANVVRTLVDECETELAHGNATQVGKIVSEAHGILAELGLSNPLIENVIAEAKNMGALAGKVSGAGGGGAVLLIAKKGDGVRLASQLTAMGHAVVSPKEI